MPINILDSDFRIAFEVIKTLSLAPEKRIKQNEIVLYIGTGGYGLDKYKINDKVYLFSPDQAMQFNPITMLEYAKEYTVAGVEKLIIEENTIMHSYMAMNPKQAKTYYSLSIDKLVMVKKADIERIFCHPENNGCVPVG